jgi:hypothetical protein
MKYANTVWQNGIANERSCSVSSSSEYEVYSNSSLYQAEPIYQVYHQTAVVYNTIKNVVGYG